MTKKTLISELATVALDSIPDKTMVDLAFTIMSGADAVIAFDGEGNPTVRKTGAESSLEAMSAAWKWIRKVGLRDPGSLPR